MDPGSPAAEQEEQWTLRTEQNIVKNSRGLACLGARDTRGGHTLWLAVPKKTGQKMPRAPLQPESGDGLLVQKRPKARGLLPCEN